MKQIASIIIRDLDTGEEFPVPFDHFRIESLVCGCCGVTDTRYFYTIPGTFSEEECFKSGKKD